MTTNQDIQTQNAETISYYLRHHPDFFVRHPQLLPILEIPHASGSAVSLVERQVKALREENRRIQGQLIDVLRTAQRNENLYQQCNELVNRWLLITDQATLLDQVSSDMQQLFDIDVTAVMTNESLQAQEICDHYEMKFPDNQPLCGAVESKIIEQVFPESHFPEQKALKSMAIIPLGQHAQFGLLILASRHIDGFSATMGTLFLEQIAAVLKTLLNKFNT